MLPVSAQVVDDQHALAGLDHMALEPQHRLQAAPVRGGEELLLDARKDRPTPADGREPDAELERDGSRQHEPARLDSDHLRHAEAAKGIRKSGARTGEEARVGEEAERVGMTLEKSEPPDELVVERPRAHTGSPT